MPAYFGEIKWVRGLLSELGIDILAPARLYCDSKAVIHIAANPVFHERTKYIDVACDAVYDSS